jgi:hypothetical protein
MYNAVQQDTFLQSLALAVARNTVGANLPLTDVLKREGVSQQEYANISANNTYQQYLTAYTKELTENGFSFSAKARVLAEDLLPNLYYIARDVDSPAPSRIKAIENLVEWGELKPKENARATMGAGFSINIVLPDGNSQSATISVTENQEPPEGTDEDEEELADHDPSVIEHGSLQQTDQQEPQKLLDHSSILTDLFGPDEATWDELEEDGAYHE